MTRMNWPALMQAGMKGLGLKPSEFWSLTPAELEFLVGRPTLALPLARNRLEELMQTYPDQDEGSENGLD